MSERPANVPPSEMTSEEASALMLAWLTDRGWTSRHDLGDEFRSRGWSGHEIRNVVARLMQRGLIGKSIGECGPTGIHSASVLLHIAGGLSRPAPVHERPKEPRKARVFSLARCEEICTLIDKGLSIEDVADIHGWKVHSVRSAARRGLAERRKAARQAKAKAATRAEAKLRKFDRVARRKKEEAQARRDAVEQARRDAEQRAAERAERDAQRKPIAEAWREARRKEEEQRPPPILREPCRNWTIEPVLPSSVTPEALAIMMSSRHDGRVERAPTLDELDAMPIGRRRPWWWRKR